MPAEVFTGCLNKLSFTELSISRFVTHIMSISSQLEAGSPKAQFGKTQLFFRHLVPFLCFLLMQDPFLSMHHAKIFLHYV